MSKKRSLLAKIFDFKMWLHDFIKITGCLPVFIDLRVKKLYIKKEKKMFRGNYIISANHISYEDPVIICASFWMRRVGFLATSELFESKLTNFLFTRFGCVPINKNNPGLDSFKKVADMVNRGHIMCVFPEGTIAREEHMGGFKSGIVMMSIMADADILPVYIAKRENRFKRQVVVVGEKINYKDFVSGPFPSIDDINNITKILLEKELELENKYLQSLKTKK